MSAMAHFDKPLYFVALPLLGIEIQITAEEQKLTIDILEHGSSTTKGNITSHTRKGELNLAN